MLKIDIEGSEIETTLNIQEKKLKQINILVIKFYHFIYLGNSFA
jgi:hypothetical protein